jgi:Ca2+/Na+ antiporter
LYFVDLARFGFLPYPAKAGIVGALTSLPMLFSGIVFVRSFTLVPDKSNALGANLIGALVGALLQSMTFVIGIKSLLLIVAFLYLLSLLTIPSQAETSEDAVPEFVQ